MAQRKVIFEKEGKVHNPITGQELTLGAGDHFLSEQFQVGSKPTSNRTPVATLSTDRARSTVNQKLQTLDEIAPIKPPEAKPKDKGEFIAPGGSLAGAQGISPTGQVIPGDQSQRAATFSFDDLVEMGITDFSGFEQTEDGSFRPNAQGYAKLGITGVDDEGSRLENDVQSVNNRIEGLANEFLTFNVNEDPDFIAEADSIRRQFDRLREEMGRTNEQRKGALQTLGFRTGGQQYVSAIQKSIEGEELRQAGRRMADIDAQEAAAISGARQAARTGKFTTFSQQMDALDKVRAQKAEALTNYNQALADIAQDIKDQNSFELEVLKFQLDQQKEERAASQFQQTFGLDVAEFQQSADQFAANLGLDREQFGFEQDKFTAQFGLERQKLSENIRQFGIETSLDALKLDIEQSKNEFDRQVKFQTLLNNSPEGEEVSIGGMTGVGRKGPETSISEEKVKLRGQIRQEPAFRSLVDVKNGFQNVKIGTELDNAQGDLAIVNGFAKMLDPTGVVRPAEFDTVEEAQGFFEKMSNVTAKIATGDRLKSDVREKFLTAANALFNEKNETLRDEIGSVYGPIAADKGFKIDDVFTTLELENVETETLESYYNANPQQQGEIEALMRENPDLSDEDVMQILQPDFRQPGTGGNVGAVSVSIPTSARLASVNNNPGNLRFVGQEGGSQGEGGFARFESPQAGFQALFNDLRAKQTGNTVTGLGPNSTLKDLVFVFAPPNENDSALYARQVAKDLNVSQNTKLNQLDTLELAKAVARKESSTRIT